MESLTKKLESRVISRLFAFMGGGAAISAATVFLLTAVPEYREFLYVRDAEGLMMLSVGAWILLLLPLMMFLSVPKELKALSFSAVLLIFGLFCSLVGAALSGVAVVYIKADMACALGVAAGMFAIMAVTEAACRKDMISWYCIVVTALWGLLLSGTVYGLFGLSLIDLAVCVATVVIFCAILAYSGSEIQRIVTAAKPDRLNHTAITAALAVFLNLIGLVVKTLRFWESKGSCK